MGAGRPGIYCIRNVVTNHRYVGRSVGIDGRWNEHKRLLREGRHHSRKLQEAWDAYGERSFSFEVLEYADPERLSELEHQHICHHDSLRNGYNMVPASRSSWMPSAAGSIGRRATDEPFGCVHAAFYIMVACAFVLALPLMLSYYLIRWVRTSPGVASATDEMERGVLVVAAAITPSLICLSLFLSDTYLMGPGVANGIGLLAVAVPLLTVVPVLIRSASRVPPRQSQDAGTRPPAGNQEAPAAGPRGTDKEPEGQSDEMALGLVGESYREALAEPLAFGGCRIVAVLKDTTAKPGGWIAVSDGHYRFIKDRSDRGVRLRDEDFEKLSDDGHLWLLP